MNDRIDRESLRVILRQEGSATYDRIRELANRNVGHTLMLMVQDGEVLKSYVRGSTVASYMLISGWEVWLHVVTGHILISQCTDEQHARAIFEAITPTSTSGIVEIELVQHKHQVETKTVVS